MSPELFKPANMWHAIVVFLTVFNADNCCCMCQVETTQLLPLFMSVHTRDSEEKNKQNNEIPPRAAPANIKYEFCWFSGNFGFHCVKKWSRL